MNTGVGDSSKVAVACCEGGVGEGFSRGKVGDCDEVTGPQPVIANRTKETKHTSIVRRYATATVNFTILSSSLKANYYRERFPTAHSRLFVGDELNEIVSAV